MAYGVPVAVCRLIHTLHQFNYVTHVLTTYWESGMGPQSVLIYCLAVELVRPSGLCNSSYSGFTWSILWVLIPWFLTSSGHQHQWYQLWNREVLHRIDWSKVSKMQCTLLKMYHKTSSMNRTKSQNINVSRLVLLLSLSGPLKPARGLGYWEISMLKSMLVN